MKLKTANRREIASIEFTLKWNTHAHHIDCYFAKEVNFLRVPFPQKIYGSLAKKKKVTPSNFFI